MCHGHVRFISGLQCWINVWKSLDVIHHTNKLKKENCMNISIDADICSTQHNLIFIPATKLEIEGNFFNLIKSTHKKILQLSSYLMAKEWMFSHKIGTMTRMCFSPLQFNIFLEVLVGKKKDIKSIQLG